MTTVDSLIIDTVEIRRHTGTRRDVRTVARLADLVVGACEVVDGDLHLALVVEAVTEGVVAHGTASGNWRGPCRRCLEEIEDDLVVDIHEIFELHPSEGETWPLTADGIDLAPVLREAALLALPLVPLCRVDCEGPEPQRFPTRVVEDETAEPAADPRWAALDGLTFDE